MSVLKHHILTHQNLSLSHFYPKYLGPSSVPGFTLLYFRISSIFRVLPWTCAVFFLRSMILCESILIQPSWTRLESWFPRNAKLMLIHIKYFSLAFMLVASWPRPLATSEACIMCLNFQTKTCCFAVTFFLIVCCSSRASPQQFGTESTWSACFRRFIL